MRRAPDDAETGAGHGRQDRRPDVAAEVIDGIDVGFPIHRTQEHHDRALGGSAGARSISCDVDPGRHDVDAPGLVIRAICVPVAVGNGDHARKPPDRLPFVARHLDGLDREDQALDGIRFVARLPAPEHRLDVVLEQHGRRGEAAGEVPRRRQEVAHGDVESAFIEDGA